MIYFSPVYTVNYHLSCISVTFYDTHRFLINTICHKIFSQCTIVTVPNPSLPLLRIVFLISAVVVHVFHIDVVDISTFHLSPFSNESVHALLSEEGCSYSQIMFIILILGCHGKLFLKPGMVQHLWDRDTFLWSKLEHSANNVFCFLTYGWIGKFELTVKNELM